MSQRALLLALRDHLRTALALGDAQEVCDVTLRGRPHPACGQQFVAIHANGWTGTNSGDYDLWEGFGAAVTITRRLPEAPQDRQATDLWLEEEGGMAKMARGVILAMHKSYAWMAIANGTYLEKASPWSGGFHHPLVFVGGTDPEIRGPEWFGATGRSDSGLVQTLRFSGAERGQNLVETVT